MAVGGDLPDVVTQESRLMEGETPPPVLLRSLQLDNLAFEIKSSSLCSRLGDTLLRSPSKTEPAMSSRVGRQPPAIGTFRICCCVLLQAKSSLGSWQPSVVPRAWPSPPNLELP